MQGILEKVVCHTESPKKTHTHRVREREREREKKKPLYPDTREVGRY